MMEAPAPGSTRFRSSIPWAVVMMLVLRCSGAPVLGGTVGGVAGGRHAQRRRWVSVSAAGIELAQLGVPIFIDWSNVASARVRRWGLVAVLEVRPVDLRLVRSLAPGPQLPPLRRLADGPGFRLEVGNLWPTPRVLRAGLTRHTNASPRQLGREVS